MRTAELDRILRELCDSLQCQIEALVGREFNDFSVMELDACVRRKRRILELQAEIEKHQKSKGGAPRAPRGSPSVVGLGPEL